MPRLWKVAVAVLALVAGATVFARHGPFLPFLEPSQPHAEGHDDLVIRIDVSAGMGSAESFFSQPPDLVVTGDGTAYTPAEEMPGDGIVTPVVTHHLGGARLGSLLKRAHHDGLLRDHPTYDVPSGVSDGSTTEVLLVTRRGRWTHSAYALDSGGWGFSERDRLADFVSRALETGRDAPATVDHSPAALRVMTTTGVLPDSSVAVASWPRDASVTPAAIGDCLVVHDPAVIRTLTTRPERYYRQGSKTYSVAAAVSLPGDACSD